MVLLMGDSLSEDEVGEEDGTEDEDEEVDATEEEVLVAVDIEDEDVKVEDMAVTCYIDSPVHSSHTNEAMTPRAPGQGNLRMIEEMLVEEALEDEAMLEAMLEATLDIDEATEAKLLATLDADAAIEDSEAAADELPTDAREDAADAALEAALDAPPAEEATTDAAEDIEATEEFWPNTSLLMLSSRSRYCSFAIRGGL